MKKTEKKILLRDMREEQDQGNGRGDGEKKVRKMREKDGGKVKESYDKG